jgi:hypothetical protein
MPSIDDLKKAIGPSLFYKDLGRFEPGRKGVVVGDYLRVYDEGETFRLRFLLGTPPSQRKPILDRMRAAKLEFSEDKDFRL